MATRTIAVRLAVALGTLAAVSVALFWAVELLPGDPAVRILGPNATPERVASLRHTMRLDQPVHERYFGWLGGVLRGDLGRTITSDRTVWDTVATPARNSAFLAVVALMVLALFAVSIGIAAGRRSGSAIDRALSTATSVAVSMPEFVTGTFLIAVFAGWLGWLPAVSLVGVGGSPWSQPEIVVLPVLTITIVAGSYGARLVRAVIAEASRAPHVDAARLAGVAERKVLWRHLLPGALGPIAQVLAFLVPYVVGGTIVVERLFGYGGLGSLLADGVARRDAKVVEAIGLFLTACVIVATALADVVGVLANPRRRTASEALR